MTDQRHREHRQCRRARVASTITFSGMTDNAAVAFMAAKTAAQTDMAAEDVITFDEAITNVGSGYDTTTSTFTAPYDGVYKLSSVVLSALEPPVCLPVAVQERRAGQRYRLVGRLREQATLTAVLSHLTQGDEITIVNGGRRRHLHSAPPATTRARGVPPHARRPSA